MTRPEAIACASPYRKIEAHFAFSLDKESRFSPDSPIVGTFADFHDLVFKRGVMRPVELKVETAAY